MQETIQTGDVCLDLAQGRACHVIDVHEGDAADWSEENNYEITENYANERLGATDDDRVYEVVYCNSAKSEPSKSYGMPESRLLRVETEAADDGRPVADRIRAEVLEDVFGAMMDTGHDTEVVAGILEETIDQGVVRESQGVAEAARISTDGGEAVGLDEFGGGE